MKELRGSYTVLITPFTRDGASVDETALRRLVEWQIGCGVPGLIILGSTGEFLSVSDDERARLVEAANSTRRPAASRSSSGPRRSGRTPPSATAGRPKRRARMRS